MAETEAGETAGAKPSAPSRDEARCAVESCKRPYRAKGYCNVHYSAWRRGELEGHRARYKTCTKESCRKPRAQGSLCAEHAAKEKEGG